MNSSSSEASSRLSIETIANAPDPVAEKQDIVDHLGRNPKSLPSRLFYDAVGSDLFDEITRLPEYYLTRTEARLLKRHAAEIVAANRACELVELGSGTSTKTRILLDAMETAGRLRRYVPFDVDGSVVRSAADELIQNYPKLHVHGVIGRFGIDIGRIPPGKRRLFLLIGSTIGNFPEDEAIELLAHIHRSMNQDDTFLLGIDLVKDIATLEAAYNDSQGVTARFNLNLLEVVNRRFGGDFDPGRFHHRAFFDVDREWIEMRLVSQEAHRVTLDELDLSVDLDSGEELRTEISCKYHRPGVEQILEKSGFELAEWITDEEKLFGLALARKS